MSKRFGRNQKRKLKAQVERLEKEHVAARNTVGWYTKRVYELERERDNVMRCLGVTFVGLDPALLDYELSKWADGRGQFQYMSPLDTRETMHLLDYKVDDQRWPQQEMHFRFRLADREVGYAISGRALYSTRVPADYLAEQMAREMARMLVDDIRKLMGGDHVS